MDTRPRPTRRDWRDARERSRAKARQDQHRTVASVSNGPRAVDYYQAAFGAVEPYRLEDDASRVIIAQLAIGQADFWL